MKALELIWWFISEAFILAGAFVALRFALVNIVLYNKDVNERIRHKTDEGMSRTDAIALISFRRKNEIIRAIGFISMTFAFVYAAIDIIFTHIIGG